MRSTAFMVVLGHVVGAALLGMWYFRRYHIARPPLGVLNGADVAAMLGGIVVVPYLYLLLPRWLVAGLLGLATISVLLPTLEPMLHHRWAARGTTIVLVIADISLALWRGGRDPAFLLLNNLVLVLLVVGITNVWAQSGMRARDAALLGGGLLVYDVVATSFLGVMDALFNQVWGLPFAPLLAWPTGGGRWLGIGLGDVLLVTLFPLVLRKAWGRAASMAALALGLGATAGMLLLLGLGIVHVTVPVMAVLGPLIIMQYIYWRWRGRERTTWHYWAADSRTAASPVSQNLEA